MALYGYVRVSTAAQANDGESLQVQARQLEGWAMMKGLTVSEMFEERGVSGSVPMKERPTGARLFAALKPGDTIVAAKLDRMFRDALDALQTVEEFKAKGINLILLDLGTDPVTNGLSELFLTIVAAFAKMERQRIRERVSQSKADAKARGRYLGGTVPFGFRKGAEGRLEPHEGEQAILTSIAAQRASKASLRAIQAKVAADHGRTLSLKTLHRIVNENGA
jgi:DNA invertase Pin-like site-specific DNA recombinase